MDISSDKSNLFYSQLSLFSDPLGINNEQENLIVNPLEKQNQGMLGNQDYSKIYPIDNLSQTEQSDFWGNQDILAFTNFEQINNSFNLKNSEINYDVVVGNFYQEDSLLNPNVLESNLENNLINNIQLPTPTGKQIVFIDGSINNYGELIPYIPENAEIFLLDSHQDGITQISNILKDYTDISTIHIISHGSAGQVQLGSSNVNGNNLLSYAQELTTWGNALIETGDILFYGCNLASDESGQIFINQFSQLTGADIAASDNLTGNQNLGGDWLLEYQIGSIESQQFQFLDYEGVFLDFFTLEDLHSAWQDGTPLDFTLGTEIELKLNDNVVITGTFNISSNDGNSLVFNATGVNGFLGYGADTTGTTADDVGIAITNGELIFTLNVDQTYSYAIDNTDVEVRGMDFLNLSTTINLTGDQTGANIALNNFDLNINNIAEISGDINLEIDSTSVKITGTDVNLFAGYGLGDTDELNDVGIGVNNLDFTLNLSADKSFSYALIESGETASFEMKNLPPEAQIALGVIGAGAWAITGGNDKIDINLDNLDLTISDYAKIAGSLQIQVSKTDGNLGFKIEGTDIDLFAGYGLGDADELNDVGLGVNNLDFRLNLSADKTFTYDFTQSGEAPSFEMKNLPSEAQIALGVIGAGAWAITGGNDKIDINLDNLDLTISDYAKIAGSLQIQVSKTDGNLGFKIEGTDVDLFAGYGLGDADELNDVGLGVNNLDFRLNLSADKTFTYDFTQSGEAPSFEMKNLPSEAQIALGVIGAGAWAITGGNDKIDINLDNLDLTISDYAKIAGSLQIQVSKTNGNLGFKIEGTDIDLFAGYGLSTADLNDDVGLNIENVDFYLALSADKTFTYDLTQGGETASFSLKGIDDITLDIQGFDANGNQNAFSIDLTGVKLDIASLLSLDIGTLNYQTNTTGTIINSTGVSLFIGDDKNTPDLGDDLGLNLNNAGLQLDINSDGSYTYNITDGDLSVLGIDGLTLSAQGVQISGDNSNTGIVTVNLQDGEFVLGNTLGLGGDNINFTYDQDTKALAFSGSSLFAFAGYGLETSDITDDVGLTLSDVTLALNINNTDGTYNYNLSNASLGIRGISGVTIEAENITATGNNNDITITSGDYALGLSSIVWLEGNGLSFSSLDNNGNRTVTFDLNNASILAGYGADTTTTADDLGININNANVDITLNNNGTYEYDLSSANAGLIGIDGITLNVGSLNATGNQNAINLTLNNAEIGVKNLLDLTANSINLNIVETAAGADISFNGVGIGGFIGYDNNIGLSLSNANLLLDINEDKSYNYNLSNADVSI
jgi:hypothetical protein